MSMNTVEVRWTILVVTSAYSSFKFVDKTTSRSCTSCLNSCPVFTRMKIVLRKLDFDSNPGDEVPLWTRFHCLNSCGCFKYFFWQRRTNELARIQFRFEENLLNCFNVLIDISFIIQNTSVQVINPKMPLRSIWDHSVWEISDLIKINSFM